MEQGLKTYEICSYIDRVAPTLSQFLQNLQELTGWSFSVLMGGPIPEAAEKIEAFSLHVGKNNLGHTFDQAHPAFRSGIMVTYQNFIEKVPGKLFVAATVYVVIEVASTFQR